MFKTPVQQQRTRCNALRRGDKIVAIFFIHLFASGQTQSVVHC